MDRQGKYMMGSIPDLAETNLLEAAFLAHENPVFVVGWKNRRILTASDSVHRVFGWRPDEIRDCTTEFLHVDETSFREFGEVTEKALETDCQIYHGDFRMKRRDGSVFDTEHMVGVIRDHADQPIASVSVVRDCSEAGSLNLPVTQEPVDLEPLSDEIPGGIFQRQRYPDGTVVYNFMRGNLLQHLGLTSEDVTRDAEVLFRRFHPDDRARHEYAMEKTHQSLSPMDIEMRIYALDGTLYWYRSISQPRRLDNGSTLWDGLIIDITEQRRAENQLRHLAMHDRMTGLPNMASFDQRLDDALVQARAVGTQVMVGALDVSRFYRVNESLGFGYGDEVLQEIGARLESRLYGNDVVARYEGDEFLIFAQDLQSSEDVERFAHQLISLFADPVRLSSNEAISISVNFGFAVFPTDEETPSALRRKADLALQRVRKDPEIAHEFYSEEMSHNVIEAVDLERRLKDAIQDNAIVPHYQGQYSVATGQLVGMEVLARWPSPDGTMVRPDRFIPLAEDTGLIHPMMEALVESVLADLRAWKDAGLTVPPAAINISAHQIRRMTFFDWLLDAVERYGLSICDLTVEITESSFLLDFEAVKSILEDLDGRGVRLSIDDFGTGYSSLSYLSQLPFRELKIDRAFISEVETDATRGAVADGIIQLGKALGLEVVAEGVETREQLDWLRGRGCDHAQGFFFGRPAPVEAFRDELARGQGG
jgi:diguanylate cyclase (GGDEF)-like protein/PAS domain S-box-containing protein